MPTSNLLLLGMQLPAGTSLKCITATRVSDEGGNADSLCLLASLATSGGTWTALFCGDAESDQLKEMIDEGALGDIDIYKVGHHGSKAALTESVVETIRPEISLVSVGEGDRYGHPAAQTLSLLDNALGRVFRTDDGRRFMRILKRWHPRYRPGIEWLHDINSKAKTTHSRLPDCGGGRAQALDRTEAAPRAPRAIR